MAIYTLQAISSKSKNSLCLLRSTESQCFEYFRKEKSNQLRLSLEPGWKTSFSVIRTPGIRSKFLSPLELAITGSLLFFEFIFTKFSKKLSQNVNKFWTLILKMVCSNLIHKSISSIFKISSIFCAKKLSSSFY